MNPYKVFAEMHTRYNDMAANIMGKPEEKTPLEDPVKRQWAMQEGFSPKYDPNSDKVTWIPQRQPHQAPNLARLRGSMSPEALAEVFPMFGHKQKQIDGTLQQIYQAAIDGQITHQRAQELVMQLALDTFKDVSKGQKVKGAAARASSLNQALAAASKNNRVAGRE